MFLHEVVAEQKRGRAIGIPSICSAHPAVLLQTLKAFAFPLVEATCNQVNQFGGYTGMTPARFVQFVRGIAEASGVPFANLLLGGDHLGPSVWQREKAGTAMQRSRVMIGEYVAAGFTKIHLDCSMPLADDPAGPLDVELSARRSAELAAAAEEARGAAPVVYVIGTEVPPPGGALEMGQAGALTSVERARSTLEASQRAFARAGLQSAWERVVALVVQPGVEFGDDFVVPYQSQAGRALADFIESQPMIFETHSTDYQSCGALTDLVRDHFAILKVGPALTFAYREAVFALALIENEMFPAIARSNLIPTIDAAMVGHPEHWQRYYSGTSDERAFKRKYSLSDRIRYYWPQTEVQRALSILMRNLGRASLPYSLLSFFVGETGLNAEQVIARKIDSVLDSYRSACGLPLSSGKPRA